MMKDDVLTENELLVLKSVLKDLTVRNKPSGIGLYEKKEISLMVTYNKIENLNKFLINQLGDWYG